MNARQSHPALEDEGARTVSDGGTEEQRARWRDLVDPGSCPQPLLRIGYPTTTDRPTPRRVVAEVLIDAPSNSGTSS